MKILIAPDKFKGSLTARQVCEAINRGLQRTDPSLEVVFHPMADGGDGSVEVLKQQLSLTRQVVETVDPLGRPIAATYYTSAEAAYIEIASASGLVLLTKDERNPLLASTLGTGKMMMDALTKGYQHIYLFLGGSATNDAGMGIATALGFQFLDQNEQLLPPNGESLAHVGSIKNTGLVDFTKTRITLLCDVNNPLFGPTGAAYVYARQKGATEAQLATLDQGLRNYSEALEQQTGVDVSCLPGSGAAGGIGASLVALCGAGLVKGFATIARLTGLEDQIQAADWVISGEGRLDDQSLQGKVVSGVAALCQQYQKPLTLFVGKNDLSAQDLARLQLRQVYSITEQAKDSEDAMQNGAAYLEEMAKLVAFSH